MAMPRNTSSPRASVVYARYDTSVGLGDGIVVVVHRGDPWDPADPIVVKHPEMFSSEPTFLRRHTGLEEATARPGERR